MAPNDSNSSSRSVDGRDGKALHLGIADDRYTGKSSRV